MADNGSKVADMAEALKRGGISPDMLKALGIQGASTQLVGTDNDIQYHDSPLIKVPQGMAMETVADIATRKAAEMNKIHNFKHITEYRPNDGAFAAFTVIKRMFGLTVGKSTKTMFGENPPSYMTIDVAYGQKVEVPWGELEIPALPGASFGFHAIDGRHGPVFAVMVSSPKKHKETIEDFFNQLDAELKVNSIYRGHALHGAYELSFMNTGTFKANEIVFADDVNATLEAALFGLIEHTEATVAAGLPTKRALLAEGPYGTGKTSLGMITAQRATAAGWTYLTGKAGRDKLKPILETAKLYQPAVVFIEDIDTHTPSASDKDAISELLDLFDGVGSKNDKIVVVMTTNHIEKVPAGMLRPGRLDYVVHIGGLDRNGVERLITRVVRKDLLAGDVDYDAVYELMADWQPAWVKAVADRSQSYALARSGGKLDYRITTEDLVGAAKGLGPQLELMGKALEGYTEPEFHVAFNNQVDTAVKASLEGAKIVDSDSDQSYALTMKPTAGYSWEVRPSRG